MSRCFHNGVTASTAAAGIAMAFRLPGNRTIHAIRFAGDDRQGIQSEQQSTQHQHEAKSFSGCIHNKLPGGLTVPLRRPLTMDCVVLGIGWQGQCQFARLNENNDLPFFSRPGMTNLVIRAVRMLLPGDMPIGKKVHSQLILIRKSMSLQSDINPMPVPQKINNNANKPFDTDCKFPLCPSTTGLVWRGPEFK